MSLTVEVRIKANLIGSVEIVNETHRIGHDEINTYSWKYSGDGHRACAGVIQHRYGDGAIVLSYKVLAEIALRYEVANQVVTDGA